MSHNSYSTAQGEILRLRAKAIIVLWLFVLTFASLPVNTAINQATFKDFIYGGDNCDYP